MSRSIVITLLASVSLSAGAQQPIPIRSLRAADAVSTDTVAFVFGVRELGDGRVLVNDAGARRLILFDRSLARSSTIADSVSGSPSPYGKRATGIIAYRGDTTLLVDAGARAFVAFDATGKPVTVLSPPRPNDVGTMGTPALGAPRVDPKGRLVYRSALPIAMKMPAPGTPFVMPQIPDSAPVVRADFDTRTADTLGWLRIPRITASSTPLEGGGMKLSALINPLSVIDDWTMLPDGSVALLRGRDYHIDWLDADGRRWSSPKMPFDWRRLSDEEKVAIVDSTRREAARQFAIGGGASVDPTGHGGNGAAVPAHSMTILKIDAPDGGPAPKMAPGAGQTVSAPEVVPAGELPDYVPPVLRSGSMTSDPEGDIWILPSTSVQSAGGLLYDVINRKGELFERVRIPPGRALAGFGAHSAIYLVAQSTGGSRLERTTIDRP